MLINSTIEIECPFTNLGQNQPCTRTISKYIRVADVVLQNVNPRCGKYKIELSGPDLEYFILSDNKLYILGEVLDFNMPSKQYQVTVSLANLETSDTIVSRNHTVCVVTCPCYES